MMDSWLQLGSSLAYEKEALPVGKLVKWIGEGKQVQYADISRDFLDRVVSNFKQFKARGIKVPIFKTHSEDPDNTRGYVEDVYVKPNSSGQDSLHVKAALNDQEAVELARNNDVSVLLPPKFVDGRGNAYEYPLRHLAITATPVLPGLDAWDGPMVFAFSSNPVAVKNDDVKGGTNVDAELKSLSEELSLEFPADATPEAKLKQVLESVKTLKLASEEDEHEDEITLSFPPVLVKQMKDNRSGVIDILVQDKTLSASMGESWKKKYCSDQALQLDLSLATEETQFDRDVELAKQITKERPLANSGRQTIKLAQGADENVLVKDAQRRADQKEKKLA